MRLDQNYNPLTSNRYNDSLDEIVDVVGEAKALGQISDQEVKLLLQLAMKKQATTAIQNFMSFQF